MRLWVIVLLCLGIAVLAVRQARGGRHLVTIAVLLLPLGYLGVQEYRDRQLLGRYAAIASEIAGRDVTIRCQGLAGSLVDVGAELGYVEWGPDGPVDHALIKHEACDALADYATGSRSHPTRDQVVAVHLLAHEAEHLAGITSEIEAECRSLQRTAWVAERLGATRVQAQHVALRYALEIYPDMPDGYRSGQCRDGGPFDLNPDVAGWPTAGGVSAS